LNVLVAEDEPDVQILYKYTLEDRGHNAILTNNGNECLKTYQEQYKHKKQSPSFFDVVILDYRMPGRMNGVDVAREILDMNPKQRIILVTAHAKETLESSIKKLKRIIELIQKPFSPQALIDTIEDKEEYEGVKSLVGKINEIEKTTGGNEKLLQKDSPSSEQIRDIFETLKKIQKGRTF
jgi:CheY-like chemotaxis protein